MSAPTCYEGNVNTAAVKCQLSLGHKAIDDGEAPTGVDLYTLQ